MLKSQTINVPSYIEDTNYRYKMPRLQLKIEGKGNGIKTNIVNLHEVAKALRCPDECTDIIIIGEKQNKDPLKFMGFEKATQTIYKYKNENDVTCIISGQFQEEEMRKCLDKFIEKYVLCQKCKYPEMLVKVKQEKITGSCECCGAKGALDNTHKLATFIIKNPPKAVQTLNSGKGEGNKATEGGDKDKQSTSKKTKAKVIMASELTLGSELLESLTQTVRDTYSRQTLNGQGGVQYLDLAQYQLTADIKSFNIENGLYDRVCYLIFQSMFDINIAKQVKDNAQILGSLYELVSPPNIELEILLNIEYLIEQHSIEDKYIPTILKYFYDTDLLTEDFLVKWGEGSTPSTQDYLQKHILWSQERDEKFRASAKQMIDWLKQNNQEEEEEDDEDEDQ